VSAKVTKRRLSIRYMYIDAVFCFSKPLRLRDYFFRAGEAVVCVYNMLPVCVTNVFVCFYLFIVLI